MDENRAALDALAGAILDGTSVDWRTVRGDADAAEHSLVDELEVVARLADFHRNHRPHSTPAPETWGHIRIVEPLGSGAFGRVYRGWDTRLDRQVALKLLPRRSDADATRTSSIIEEGRLLARVRHPNVVTIYGAERIGDTVGLWMELIEGETVEHRLIHGPAFRCSEVIDIGTQVCAAVSAVHAAGLLHRDIKAQNVMLAPSGRAVLMDFGTGWEVSGASDSRTLAGTPLYLAPELFRGGQATIRSDVYSVGVLLYRMLTGTYPVGGESLAALRLAHARRNRHGLLAIRRDVPRRLAGIIDCAIDPDADRRYESVAALATELAALQRHGARMTRKHAMAIAAAVVAGAVLIWPGALRLRQPVVATQSGPGQPIAVLPLKSLGTSTGDEELADGLTEEIINGLAASDHLQVRSRSSSFAFKNKSENLHDVAQQLDVDLLVDGSIRRSGNRFQVDVRLLQTSTGATLWTEHFDGDVGNVFAARNRIVQSVIGQLRVNGAPSRRAYDLNPEAYGRYLTARALVSHRGVLDAQKAIEYFHQVIAIAPDFAPAYAGIADAYAYMSLSTYQGVPVAKAQELMRTAAIKALDLDPDLAEAHAAMGLVEARDLAWASSQQHFEKAIALNPSLSQVYTNYSFFTLRPLRQFAKAERLLKIALQRDPLSLDVWREMAELYLTVARYDEAIDLLQRLRAVDPKFPGSDLVLARALALRGRVDEALALYDADDPTATGVPHYRAYAYVKAGRRLDAAKLAADNERFPYRATIIYAALGDRDRAFEALTQTAAREPQRIPLLLTWPEMAPLRSDPRIDPIRRRFGLP